MSRRGLHKALAARITPVIAAALALVITVMPASVMPASAEILPLPWPLPASPPLPPDYTVPYLAGVRTICPEGSISCFYDLEHILVKRTQALACSHEAIAADAYLTITQRLITASNTPGFFQRPDRLNHEARQYAQEYIDQADTWRAGDRASVSPSWNIAMQAMEEESVTGTGDLLLWLNAHIRRDNPIRAVEQTEGVLRVEGDMPAASGRYDHDQVSEALQDSLEPMLAHNAAVYDPTVDDGAVLFGRVMDAEGLYLTISEWREEAWRHGEELRHARAQGGVDGVLYQAKLAQIEEAARVTAEAIKAATLTTPEQNAARNAYCAAHFQG